MTQLMIHLLGGLIIEQDGKPIPKLVSRKTDILLAYLAQEPRSHSRETLATLLWGDRSQKQALSNLRTLISSLRKHADAFVTISRQALEIKEGVQVDTAVFIQQLAAAQEQWPSPTAIEQMEQALTLYTGEFLEGVVAASSLEMEDWIQFTREQLRQKTIEAHQQLSAYYLQQGATHDGIRHATILLEMDPWNEETHQQMMRLLARSGQRQAALAQYEACVKVLDEELGVPPEPETTALYERIQTAVSTPTSNLPAIATTFVGREQELSHCLDNLRDPDCRLLTLVGLGGIGKTRLALQVADALQLDFLNGVYFIPLAAVDSPNSLATAVIETLPLSFYDTTDVETQLLNFLRGKEMLLVLDNFENLLAGATLLAKIIREAPAVKFLTTSRLRLDLRMEWLLEVEGLPYPHEETAVTAKAEAYAAIHLFEQRARVIAPNFSLTPNNLPSIHRICKIVHGMPLGIELAAAWTRILPIDHIAQHLAQNLDLLATTMRDVPERQRSLTAVFDYVWSLLNEEEQTIFAKLSVFRGSFDLKAFKTITGGSPWVLAALVEKSLLHQATKTNRYTFIEALRLYATTKQMQLPTRQQQTQQAHSHFYAEWLHQQESSLQSRQVKSAVDTIRLELDNIHAAWNYAVATYCFEDIGLSQQSLTHYYSYNGPYQEGEALLTTAVQELTPLIDNNATDNPDQIRVLAQAHNNHARLAHLTANFDEGIGSAQKAIDLSHRIDDINGQATGYFHLGALTERKSDYETAISYGKKAIALAQKAGNEAIAAETHRFCGTCLHRLSQYEAAKTEHDLGLKIARRIQQPQIIANCLRGLGNANRILGDFASAKVYHEESVDIARDIGDLMSLNAGYTNLAILSSSAGRYDVAATYYQQILSFYRQMGNQYFEALSLVNIGGNKMQTNQFQEAEKLYRQAVSLAQEVGNKWVEHISYLNLSEVLNVLSKYQEAQEYAEIALRFFEGIEEKMARTYALIEIGESFVGLKQPEKAIPMFQEAVDVRRQFKGMPQIMESLAGLARAALAQDDKQQASAAAEEIADYLEAGNSLDGTSMTLRIYMSCYASLNASHNPRANTILEMAYKDLQDRTNRIQDEAVRQTYYSSPFWHQNVLKLYAESNH